MSFTPIIHDVSKDSEQDEIQNPRIQELNYNKNILESMGPEIERLCAVIRSLWYIIY